MTLGLEEMLADLRSGDDASSGNLAARAYRSGELVRLCGEWGPEKMESPLSEFCTAAEEFLEWIRSQPAAESHDMWVVLASWLVGGIADDDAARKLHTRHGEDSETLLRRLVERFGHEGRQETFENLASTIAVSATNLEIDPRVGAAAIAGLASGRTDANTELASLIQPSSPCSPQRGMPRDGRLSSPRPSTGSPPPPNSSAVREPDSDPAGDRTPRQSPGQPAARLLR